MACVCTRISRRHRDESCSACVGGINTRSWVIDSGAGCDLIGKNSASNSELEKSVHSDRVYNFATANGQTETRDKVSCEVEGINAIIQPHLLDQCPAVMSLGRRVMQDGFSFHWSSKEPESPFLVDPLGNLIKLRVHNFVPVLDEAVTTESRAYTVLERDEHEEVIAQHRENGEKRDSSVSDVVHVIQRACPGGETGDDGMLNEPEHMGEDEVDEQTIEPELRKSEFIRRGRQRDSATTRTHMFTHFPKNHFCECCRKAKATHEQARRIRPGREKLKADRFGQVLHIDHLIAGAESRGAQGETCAVVILDQWTRFSGVYPCNKKSGEEVINAIRHFMGMCDDWKHVSVKSDNSHEIAHAVRSLGLAHYVSTPYRHQSNGLIERHIRRLVESTRANLMQACLPVCYWPQAMRHASMSYNLYTPIEEDGATAWGRRMGSECEWHALPFGATVGAIVHGRREDAQAKFDPGACACVFIGWHEAPGWVWTDFEVITWTQMKSIVNGEKVSSYRTRELILESGISFPSIVDEGDTDDGSYDVALRHVPLEDAERAEPQHEMTHEARTETPERMDDDVIDRIVEPGEAMTEEMKSKGWRIDKFGERLVRVPPRSTRPSCFSPEDWRSMSISVRRACTERERERQRRAGEVQTGVDDDSGVPATVSTQYEAGCSFVCDVCVLVYGECYEEMCHAASALSKLMKCSEVDFNMVCGTKNWSSHQLSQAMGTGERQDAVVMRGGPRTASELACWLRRAQIMFGRVVYCATPRNGNSDLQVEDGSNLGYQDTLDALTVLSKCYWVPDRSDENAYHEAIAAAAAHSTGARLHAVWFAGECRSMGGQGQSVTLTSKTLERCMALCREKDNQIVFELCCAEDSLMGRRNPAQVTVIRVTSQSDLTKRECVHQVKQLVQAAAHRAHLWVSTPCRSGCPWLRTTPNVRNKSTFQSALAHDLLLAKHSLELVETAHEQGSTFTWEWPQQCDHWNTSTGDRLLGFEGAASIVVHGCSMHTQQPCPQAKKPWRLITNSPAITTAFRGQRCSGKHAHIACRGSVARDSESYTPYMVDLFLCAVGPHHKRGGMSILSDSNNPRRHNDSAADASSNDSAADASLEVEEELERARNHAMLNACSAWGCSGLREMREICHDLNEAVDGKLLPLSSTRTNVFDSQGGRLRGINFGAQVGRGRGISAQDKRWSRVLALIHELGQHRPTRSAYMAVQMNMLTSGNKIKAHVDVKNDGDAWVIAWGNYCGGALWVQASDNKWQQRNAHMQWQRIPMKSMHSVSEVTSGTRISIVLYTPTGASVKLGDDLLRELQEDGFPQECSEQQATIGEPMGEVQALIANQTARENHDGKLGHVPNEGHEIDGVWGAAVVRQILPSDPEYRSEGARAALDAELQKLRDKQTWDTSEVLELSELKKHKKYEEALVGRVFAILGEKHAEEQRKDKLYKARIVFQGNRITSISGTPAHELFKQLSNSPVTMSSARTAMAIGLINGRKVQLRDASQAYLQSWINTKEHTPTFIILPKEWWPDEWFDKQGKPLYHSPVCRLTKALYGHPESGAVWEKHLSKVLKNLQWRPVEGHASTWVKDLPNGDGTASLVVYVDDMMMCAPENACDRLWHEIDSRIEFKDPPEDVSKYLGAGHRIDIKNGSIHMEVEMHDYLRCAIDKFKG
eukprot:3648649-Amphidinium_carterae.1